MMGIDEKYILVGIVIGGILLTVVQICLLKFVREYRKYSCILPIIFLLTAIGFSVLDSNTFYYEKILGADSELILPMTNGGGNYQPKEFGIDWWGTIIDWFPRLFFSLLPFVPTIIHMRNNRKRKKNNEKI